MPDITFTTWGHAGIRLERDGRALVIDPGVFTDPHVLETTDAVLITHEHPDHFEPGRLGRWLSASPDRRLFGPDVVTSRLVDTDARQRVTVDGGNRLHVAGFDVQAVGHRHAEVHPDVPLVANVAYLIDDSIFHPGDSFTQPPSDASIRVLALPISAPWLKVSEAVDYLRRVAPAVAVPIHDAILNDHGKALTDRVIGGLAGEVEYRRLGPGEILTVS